MSSKNKRQRKSNVNLFFNQQINIFPEDFFSTYDKKSNFNIEKSRNIPHPKIILPKFKENPKTNSFVNARNINKNNEEVTKTNFTNVIKLDYINNLEFSFQAPATPDKGTKLNKNNKNHSNSAMTKNNSFQPLFRSPFNNKFKKYEMVNRSSQSSNKNNKIANIPNKINKTYKCKYRNIKSNELFKETKLKFLKNKNITNLSTYNQKERDKDQMNEKEKEKEIPKNINTNLTSRKNDNKKTKYNNYRVSTPIIKNKVIKKILNINKSKEIILRTNSLKAFNNKNNEIDKKVKNKPKEITLKSSSLKLINNKKANSIVDSEKKIINKSKILANMNNFNKRAYSSKNYSKQKNFIYL